jgi:hypothetical protein
MARRILSIALFVAFTQLALACHKHRDTRDERWARRHHVPYQAGDSCSCYGSGGAVIAPPPAIVPTETLPSPKKMPPTTMTPPSLNATPVYGTPVYNGR